MPDVPLHQPTDTPPRKGLGPWMSLAMVVGTMIGSGIYLLPAVLAPFGPNMVAAWALTIAGTMCIAFAMAQLAARIPGGPTVYVTRAFGELPAFVTMWSYLVSVWTGIAAVALATAGALSYVFPATGSGTGLMIVAAGSIVILAGVNLTGVRKSGALQVAATLIKIVPLVAVLLLVAGRLGGNQPLVPLAPVALGWSGVLAAAALTLFSLTGFEVGAITAPVTENAERNVPRSQIIGVGFTGLMYLGATLAVLWLLPSALAAESKAPFADAIAPALGHVAGSFVALIAAISAFGANNALVLGSAEVMRSLAAQGNLPPLFARRNAGGVPYAAIIAGAAAGITLLVLSAAPGFVSVYAFIALVSAVASLVLYAMCSAAVLKLRMTGRGFGTVIAVAALAYSIAMFFGAGWEATKWGVALAVAGIPIRWISRRLWPNRAEAAPAAEPRGSAA
jgi:APA family basic amino acid/polyamine antiporter